MSQQISLKETEKIVYSRTTQDGLMDILLGCFFLLFAVAPFLSASLGDFWGSVVFLPFWALVYLGIWLIRKFVVTPRIGTVKFGPVRQKKLARFTVVMLVLNSIALLLGIVAVYSFGSFPGEWYGIILGMILIVGFSTAAYLLNINRLYVYGLLAGFAPLIGEWLWAHGYASHHGFPITFGVMAGVMILTGLVLFIRLLYENPLPSDGIPPEEA